MPDQLLISDANIIIDMEVAELTDLMFSLPYEYMTPNSLFEEELHDLHDDLVEKGLRLETLTPKLIKRVQILSEKYDGLSNHDLSAMALAEDKDVPLLTGDGKLRQVCLEEGVDVRGTLWLMDQFFSAGLISVVDAEKAYARMEEDGSRLPWGEVKKQIKEFKKR